MSRNQYLSATAVASIIGRFLDLDMDVYQWQVDDGVFDGIMFRSQDADVIRKIDDLERELADAESDIGEHAG